MELIHRIITSILLINGKDDMSFKYYVKHVIRKRYR